MALDSLPGFDTEESEAVLRTRTDPDAPGEVFQSNSTVVRVYFSTDDDHVTASAVGDIVVRERRS